MEGLFKTALSGFKKDDVLNFIDKQEKEFRAMEKELGDQLEGLRQQLSEMTAEKTALQKKADGLEAMVEQQQEHYAKAEEKIALLAGESESRRCALNRAEAVIEDLKHEIADLRQKNDAAAARTEADGAEIARLNETIRTIGTTQERISRVMVEAQNTADNIVWVARSQAADMIREAEDRIKGLTQQADDLKIRIGGLENGTEDFLESVSDMARTLSEAAAALENTQLKTPNMAPPPEPETAAPPEEAPMFDWDEEGSN